MTLPPLTVEAMRRLCQELMKDGKGDYTFVIEESSGEYSPTNATRNDTDKTVKLS